MLPNSVEAVNEAVLSNARYAQGCARRALAVGATDNSGFDDVVQDAFEHMLKKGRKFNGNGELSKFVGQNLTNRLMRTVFRSNAIIRPPVGCKNPDPNLCAVAKEEDLRREVDPRHEKRERALELHDALAALLAKLPNNEEVVMRQLFGFEGPALTPAQIAHAAGCPVNVIYETRTKALRRLRKMGAKDSLRSFYLAE